MKNITPLFISVIFTVFCLFPIGNIYCQVKKPANKILFGKPVKAGTVNPNNGLIRCATSEYEEYLQEKNPKRRTSTQFENWLSPLVSKYKVAKATSKIAATVITIPVVVHVIHSGEAIGTAPNTTDAQIQSQITVLNQDFRKLLGTPGHNTNPVGADVEIEFVLAKQDPNGNPTNGIDRVYFVKESWSDTEIDDILKPATIWNPDLYMNMWSLKFSDDSLLGYAQFPDNKFATSSPNYLDGLDFSGGSANTDGVVASFDVFGSSDFGNNFILNKPYDKGRTMTHEVGHFLGLLHIWGDGEGDEDANSPDCKASDYCADTPQVGWEHYDCLKTYNTCPSNPGNDMPENYMDYTNDECMNIFTQNQKDRIAVIMNNAARRVTLKTSTKDDPISLFANDAEVQIEGGNYAITTENATCNTLPSPSNKNIAIYNRGTANLTSIILNYSIGGGANQTYTWTGSLSQNQSAIVALPNSTAVGTLNVNINSVNGGADERNTNNAATATFTAPSGPSNYNLTTLTFRLQQDKWGSETTWSLKNSLGTTLYKGGPYDDNSSLPALITRNWTVSSNQCYTFTIEDSAGDGICCGSTNGNGSYSIKSSDGSITIKSGSDFGSSDTKSFSTNTLGTAEFDALNEIYVYPNPTKGTLNIHVSGAFGLPNSYTISNTSGQIISRKAVSTEADLIVNTSSLSNGVYFVTVTKEDQSRTLQFIKE